MQFYNLKTKESVEVPESQIKKRRSYRKTSNGVVQERYAAVATVNVGSAPLTLYKFVNRTTYDGLKVPEID